MPTTPISVSVGVQGNTNTTIYTVPVGKTAIVKAVSTVAANGGNTQTTISKLSNGQNFVVVSNQYSNVTPATGSTERQNENQLTAPLTMAAGEELKTYVNAGSVYNFPSVSSAMSNNAADGSVVTINAIKYGNGIYMAVGSCSTGIYVGTSTDAITWTQQTQAVGLGSNMNRLEYANGVWVAITYNLAGSVFFSTDNGVNWAYATGVSGFTPRGLYSGNNTFVINATNGSVYYSTDGNNWTGSNSIYNILNPSGQFFLNMGYTGTHWVGSTPFGNYATTDFVTWKGFGSCDGNRLLTTGSTAYNDISYSSTYNKYYCTRQGAGVLNLFSSTKGLIWDSEILAGGNDPGRVCIAGTNPVIIIMRNTTQPTRWVSTNGSTFTVATDSQTYTGKVFGLENGYFLSFSTPTSGQCYLSTNPITGAGSTSGGGSAPDFTARSAAADPITGKWCALGKDVGSNRWITLGGTSGTNIGSAYLPGFGIDSTNGNPMAVAWSAADNAFYAVSDTGKIYRATSYNSTWTQLAVSNIPSNYNTNTPWVIKVVGTKIIVMMGQNTTYSYNMWVGSTLNGGASFTLVNYSSNYSSSNWRPCYVTASSFYSGGDTLIASDGTNVLFVNGMGQVSSFNVNNQTALVSPPTSFGTCQVQGSFGFAYGGYYENNATAISGFYYSTNLSTEWGSYGGINEFNLQSSQQPPNKIAYVGGKYYFNNFNISGGMWSGTSPASISVAYVGSSFAGISPVSPNLGWAFDGTNLVGVNNRLNGFMKTSTPANFLYAGTVTASIVEVS